MGNKVTPDRVINPVTVLAWDGSDFYALKCNDEGILEIAAVVVEMPEGLATEATLLNRASEAKLELVRLLLVNLAAEDFATQTTLAALLTELQAKADLDETQPVSVASLPLPGGAATSAYQAALTGNMLLRSVTPVIYNVVMTVAGNPYSQVLPANGKKFLIRCRGLYDLRVAFSEGGLVTNYLTVPPGMSYWEDLLGYVVLTLYFRCDTASQFAEIVVWS